MNTEHVEDAQVLDITPVSKEQALTKLDDYNTAEELESYCQKLIDGKLVPSSLKTPQAMMTVVMMGRELGFKAMASISNIQPISGKPTLGVHAIGAILEKAGVEKQTIEDFVPVLGTKGVDDKGVEFDLTDKVVDYRTTIRFTRPSRFGGAITEDVSFTWKEATKMELTSKDNWKRMPKVMLWSRCFSLGARRAAPAAMLGMMEVSEWCDATNQDYKVDEEGKVTILN